MLLLTWSVIIKAVQSIICVIVSTFHNHFKKRNAMN